MKKPASRIRQEIARLQEQLRQAETRDAERIGRIALKAGLGEFEIDDAAFLAAFEEIGTRFRKSERLTGRRKSDAGEPLVAETPSFAARPASGAAQEG